MRKLSQKEVLACLLFIGLLVVVYTQLKRGVFARSAAAPDIRAQGKTADVAKLPEIPVVDVGPQPQATIRVNSRNLFNYSKSPEQVAEEIRQRREAELAAERAATAARLEQERAAMVAAAAAAERAKLPPPKPPPPQITFRLIGKMGSPKAPLAVLADGNEIYTVKEGEVVNEKFRIIKIDYESVTIGYVNPEWPETRTIKMGT